MSKWKCFLPILLFIVNRGIANQENKFKLYDVDHQVREIEVELNNIDNYIAVYTDQDTICIKGYRWLTDSIKILDNRFLELKYSTWGGSGIKVERYLLISLSKNAIVVSLDILSQQTSNFSRTYDREVDKDSLYDEHESYKANFALCKNSSGCAALIIVNDTVLSKYNPELNKKTKDSACLFFDSKSLIFYTKKIKLGGEYNTIDSDNRNEKIFLKSDSYPAIVLGKISYYYIGNRWYERGQSNYLFYTSCR